MADDASTKEKRTFSFVDAIENKQTIIVSAHECDARGCLGDCCEEEDGSGRLFSDITDNNNRPGFSSDVSSLRESSCTNATSKSFRPGEFFIDLVSDDDNSARKIKEEQQPSAEYVASSSDEYEFSSQVEVLSVHSNSSDETSPDECENESRSSFIDDSSVSSGSFIASEQDENDSDVASLSNRYVEGYAAANSNVTRRSFLRQRDELTAAAFEEFDTNVFDGALKSVSVSWSKRLLKTAGLTYLKQIKNMPTKRTAHIELSCKVVDNKQRLRSTLLHEMCHAAAWLIDGVSSPPHGSCFQKWANFAMQKVHHRSTLYSVTNIILCAYN